MGERIKVIYVDDDEDDREWFKLYVTQYWPECDLTCVADAVGFGEWLVQHHGPHTLAILDMRIGPYTGDGLTRSLKNSPIYHNTPVVILTGHDTPFVQQLCYEAGADAFFVKPASQEESLRMIDTLKQRFSPYQRDQVHLSR